MQYHEFLRLAETTEAECPYRLYAEHIEPAYMGNDDLFPTQEAVAAYWRAYGARAFLPDILDRLREAITAVRDCCYFSSGLRRLDADGIEEWIVREAAKRAC